MVRSAAFWEGLVSMRSLNGMGEVVTNLQQVLSSVKPILGKPPSAILILHDQVERLVEFAVETQRVVRLVRFSNSRHGPLDLQFQILLRALAELRIARDRFLVGFLVAHRLSGQNLPTLSIPNESLTLGVSRARLVANHHLIIPRLVAVTAVDTDVPGGGFAVLGFALPLDVGRGSFLVVEVAAEGQGETLVQALLVEEVRLLEAREVARDEGWARDDGRGEHAVGFARRLGGGDGGDVLGGGGLCCCGGGGGVLARLL